MQTSTIVVLACLIAVAIAQAQYEPRAVNPALEAAFDSPAHDRSPRNRRGLFLHHKKLILGSLGLKALKVGAVGAVGAAGAVGALALKKFKAPKIVPHAYYHHGAPPLIIKY